MLPSSLANFDPAQFHSQFPALSTNIATSIAQKSGLDPSKPADVVTAMHSDAYKNQAMQATTASASPSPRPRARIQPPGAPDPTMAAGYTPPAPAAPAPTDAGAPAAPAAPSGPDTDFSAGRGVQDELTAGYSEKSQAYLNNRAQLDQLNQQEIQAARAAAKLAAFNKNEYIDKRMKELNPTESVDSQIMQLRQKALFERASMWEEVAGLPWQQQQQAIASRMNVYTSQMDDLSKFRQARLDDATAKINREVDNYTTRIDASKTRIDAIQRSIENAKSMGADDAAIAQLHIDHAKEEKALQKTRSGSGSAATGTEMIEASLLQQYKESHGYDATGSDLARIKINAKIINDTDPQTKQDIAGANGNYDALPPIGTQSVTSTPEDTRNGFQRFVGNHDFGLWWQPPAPVTTDEPINRLSRYDMQESPTVAARNRKAAASK